MRYTSHNRYGVIISEYNNHGKTCIEQEQRIHY